VRGPFELGGLHTASSLEISNQVSRLFWKSALDSRNNNLELLVKIKLRGRGGVAFTFFLICLYDILRSAKHRSGAASA
jgi:hypothetical protein